MRVIILAVLLPLGALAQETDEAIADEGNQVIAELDSRAEQQREMFKLYTDCRPISSTVSVFGDHTEIGLDQNQINIAIESRLRAARIYRDYDGTTPNLSVSIGITNNGFAMMMAFQRTLYNRSGNPVFNAHLIGEIAGTASEDDINLMQEARRRGLIPPYSGVASTWSSSLMVGVHAGDETYIRITVNDMLDEFLAGYLRINERDCNNP